jgi:hypothetical protein
MSETELYKENIDKDLQWEYLIHIKSRKKSIKVLEKWRSWLNTTRGYKKKGKCDFKIIMNYLKQIDKAQSCIVRIR